MLKYLHVGHSGIKRTLTRACTCLFWLGISADICRFVSSCTECMTLQNSNPREPDYPWQVVVTDLFQWDEKDFLVIVDYYNWYFKVARVHFTTSKAIIQHMKLTFFWYGIPEKILFDDGPQFSSTEFAKFSEDYDFYTPQPAQAPPHTHTPIQWLSRANSSNSLKNPIVGIRQQ